MLEISVCYFAVYVALYFGQC